MKEEVEKLLIAYGSVVESQGYNIPELEMAVNAIMELHQQQIKELKEFAEQKRIMNADNPQYVLGYNFAKEELKSVLDKKLPDIIKEIEG